MSTLSELGTWSFFFHAQNILFCYAIGTKFRVLNFLSTPLRAEIGLNNILFIIRYIHAYIQTIQLTIGSDGKHSAYMKVIS